MGDDKVQLRPFASATVNGTDSSLTVGVTVDAALELMGLRLSAGGARASVVLPFTHDGRPGLPQELAVVLEKPQSFSAKLDLPIISAGGSLAHVGTTYRGSLQADLGVVTVTGYAVLTPQAHPDFVVVLAAEFDPGIQLSFGFTLLGVGGLIGVNRGPDREKLSAALSSGALSQLLFPPRGVSADRTLATLDECFPRRPGAFVAGPMLELGWGTPTLVSAAVAVLVSDDALTVLGRLLLTLPDERLDLIHLEALVLGRVDADGLAIDATLVNSRIVTVPIEGDFRLRARGGDDGLFALSAGGFHPDFVPPPGMAGMKRLGTHISPAPLVDLRLEAYLAVTPNAAQLGARVEIMAGIDGFSLRGSGSFDAILTLAPALRLDARFTASVRIECAGFDVAGVALSLAVSGPDPWRARGRATITVFGADVDIDLPEIGGGEPPAPPPPPVRSPAAALAALLSQAERWCPVGSEVPGLVQRAPGSTGVHPLAPLAFDQSVVPLGTSIRRMDGLPLAAPVTLEVRDAAGTTFATPRKAAFVPRELFDVDPAAQRSSGGYLRLPSGFSLAPHATQVVGTRVQQDTDYEELVVGVAGRTAVPAGAVPESALNRASEAPPDRPVLVRFGEWDAEDVLAGAAPPWEQVP